MSRPRIYLIEDDAAVRDALQMVLAETGHQVEAFAAADTFLQYGHARRPGCLILDLRLPRMSGIELLQLLAREGRHLPTIVISAHGDIPTAVHSMQLGAIDFLQKPFDNEVLLERIHRCLTHEMARFKIIEARDLCRRQLAVLSNRERQILDLTANGLLNKQIAYELSISPRTVEVHRANIRQKLGVSHSSELVRIALLARDDLTD